MASEECGTTFTFYTGRPSSLATLFTNCVVRIHGRGVIGIRTAISSVSRVKIWGSPLVCTSSAILNSSGTLLISMCLSSWLTAIGLLLEYFFIKRVTYLRIHSNSPQPYFVTWWQETQRLSGVV